jgi:hypothetical protein
VTTRPSIGEFRPHRSPERALTLPWRSTSSPGSRSRSGRRAGFRRLRRPGTVVRRTTVAWS